MRKILVLLYTPYKLFILFPIIILATLIIGTLAIIIAVVYSPKFASTYFAGSWARVNAYSTPMFISVYGKENINKATSYVVMPNHQSLYDILVIYGWLGIPIKWVIKMELRKVPMLGLVCEKLGHIYLDRSNKEKAIKTLKEAKNNLTDGSSVVIFPEGSRSTNDELLPLKKGAFKLAFDLGIPILPVTIMGTRKVLPTETFAILPGKVKMIIHKPIDINNYKADEIDKLMAKVAETVGKPLKENKNNSQK